MRWIKNVYLEDAAEKRPSELSGGMRRRVALARAFAYGGSLLLLDEPFSGIDAQIKNALISLLSQMKKEKLIVLITHYPEEAVRLADVIHVLSGSPVHIAETVTVPKEIREDQGRAFALAQRLTAHFPTNPQA